MTAAQAHPAKAGRAAGTGGTAVEEEAQRAADRPAEAQRRRNVRLLVLLLGVVGGLLLASIAFVALRN